MNCRFDKDILQKYVDNTIDPLEFIFLKEHLNYCVECKQELDVLMRLDEELYEFFDAEPDFSGHGLNIEKLVENCQYESEKQHLLRFVLKKAVEIGGNVVGNTTIFTQYLPGNKLVRNGAKKTAVAAGHIVKSALSKEVKRLLTSGS